MPFINDMLDSVERQKADKDALAAENETEVVATERSSTNLLQTRYRFDVDDVMAVVRHEVRGQPHALDAIERMLKVVRADIADPRRPPFTALFLGPTGVGKTETVRAVARGLYGDADAVCRVDMNTLSQEHYAAALTGAPPGYVGAKEGKTILDQELLEGRGGKPGIVLLDELEKASPEVTQALLNIFDNGQLTVASGERTYSFRNSLVFMTSNLGARDIYNQEKTAGTGWRRIFPGHRAAQRREMHELLRDKLNAHFSPEFVNRIDNVTVFNWIERDLVEELVDVEIERLNRRLRKHACQLRLTEEARRSVAEAGFDRQYGARALRRAIRAKVEVPFAEYLLTTPAAGPRDSEEITVYEAVLSGGDLYFSPR